MQNKIVIALLAAVVAITLGAFAGKKLGDADRKAGEAISDYQKEQAMHLGKTVIIGKDTLKVININFWCEYVLSDGRTLSPDYFDNN